MYGHISSILAIAAAGIALSLSSTGVAAKDYTRSCTATYVISATTPTGARLTGANFSFTGKGTVGYYAPNTARERALKNINECVDDAWAHRLGTSVPRACTSSNQIHGYPFTGLHVGIMQAVCLANRGHDQILINLHVGYDGDTGCIAYPNIWRRLITQAYTINCPDYSAGPSH